MAETSENARIRELEAELLEVRAAFEEYIQSSQKLEGGFDLELESMKEKLASTSNSNEVLASQLEKMEPMLTELESALSSSKTRLKEESQLRKQSEMARVEIEARHEESEAAMQTLKEENESLREENIALREKLEFKCHELEKLKEVDMNDRKQLYELGSRLQARIQERGESRGNVLGSKTQSTEDDAKRAESTPDDSYTEVLDELEGVTEQLIATQQKLWATEDKLRESETRILMIGVSHKRVEKETDEAIQVNTLKDEAPHTENELLKLRQRLAESMEENATLVEEVACLRDILQDKDNTTEAIRSTVVAESAKTREREINILREKLRNIVKENSRLKQAVSHFESGVPTTFVRKEEVSTLKKEIAKLKASLQMEESEKKHALEKADSVWRMKMDQMVEEMDGEKDMVLAQMRGEMMERTSAAMEALSDEKYSLECQVDTLESDIRKYKEEAAKSREEAILASENLKATRDESTNLKKRICSLSTDLEHTKRLLSKAEEDAMKAHERYADVCAELEVARQILDEAGLEEETIAREDETEMKRQIHSLSKALEQMRQDYAELENDFLDSQHRFHDAQEEASRKSEDEIVFLTKRLAEMERALESARSDHSIISSKLEEARKDCHEALKKGERNGRENAERALKAQHNQERKLLMDRLESMADKSTTANMTREQSEESRAADPADATHLKQRVDELEIELKECQDELMLRKQQNAQLVFDLKETRKSGLEGVKVLDKVFGSTNVQFTPDPEPLADGEGVEVIQRASKDAEWNPVRDAPSEASSYLAGRKLTAMEAQSPDFMRLRSKLIDVTLENENLKEQIINMGVSPELHGISDFSTRAVSNDVKNLIMSLEQALENSDETSENLEALNQKLIVSETKLEATEEALNSAKDENKALRNEVLTLKDSLRETRRNFELVKKELRMAKTVNADVKKQLEYTEHEIAEAVRADRGNDFKELRAQFKKITKEKASLQHQLDDTKIALSVSQYAQERNKEELRATETKLSSSMEEAFKLKEELQNMSRSLEGVKIAYDTALGGVKRSLPESAADSESQQAVPSLSKQLEQLSEENGGLQQMVTELEEALELAQQEIDKKTQQVDSLHDSLVSSQEEARLLTEEISHLTESYEAAKAEYSTVVDELDIVNKLFEEARDEAERDGTEAAIEQARLEVHDSREQERKAVKEQVKKIFDDNARLQAKLSETESLLNSQMATDPQADQTQVLREELAKLQASLTESTGEIRKLREKELNLDLDLKDAKQKLKQSQEELVIMTENYESLARREKSTTSKSALDQLMSDQQQEERLALQQQLKKVIEWTQKDQSKVGSSEHEETEALELKVELLDMSMSLEKMMFEKMIIEDELNNVKRTVEDARREGELQGRMAAGKDIRTELRLEREKEMKELKSKFNELVEENADLSNKLRNAEVQLSLTMNTQQHGTSEMEKLHSELKAAKAENEKFKQEVFNLTVEIESAHDDHEEAIETLRSSSKIERDNRLKEIQNKLKTLTVENATLRQKLRGAEARLESSLNPEGRKKSEMDGLDVSLKESQAIVSDLEEQVSNLKEDLRAIKATNKELTSEKIILEAKLDEVEGALKDTKAGTENKSRDLREALKLSKEENSILRANTSQLKQALEISTKELDHLREQFDRVGHEVDARDKSEAGILRGQLEKLAEEKAALQQQVDEIQMALSINKLSQHGNVEELKIFQKSLLLSKEESTVHQVDLSKLSEELAKTVEDFNEAMETIREVTLVLDTVEGLHLAKDSSTDGRLSGRASAVTARVSALIDMLRQTKEHQTSMKDAVRQVSTENKLVEKRVAASETALEKVRQVQLKDRKQLELAEQKLAESRKECSGYCNEISRLKTALEYAQSEHTALREQLERMNLRVAQMCLEAEAKAKASAAAALQISFGDVDEKDSVEFMTQFKRFYEENDTLQGNGTKDVMVIATDREAEIRVMQDQFKQLSAQSFSLEQKMEDAERAVTNMKSEQGSLFEENESTKQQGRRLEQQVAKAVDDCSKRDSEIEDISAAMGNRVLMAEQNLNRLEREISVAKGKLQVTEAGLFVLRRQHKKNETVRDGASEQRESIKSSEENTTHSESREDTNVLELKRPRVGTSVRPQVQPAKRDTSLTLRALDAIAQSKKRNTVRKFDVKSNKGKKAIGSHFHFQEKASPQNAVDQAVQADAQRLLLSGEERE